MFYIQLGDVLKAPVTQDIVQQVNCQGKCGKGVVVPIFNKYPGAKDRYIDYCNTKDKKSLLGTAIAYGAPDGRIVFSLFGQWKTAMHQFELATDYRALNAALEDMAEFINKNPDSNRHLAIPWMIGAGLANGDINIIYNLIHDICKRENIDVTFYVNDVTILPINISKFQDLECLQDLYNEKGIIK